MIPANEPHRNEPIVLSDAVADAVAKQAQSGLAGLANAMSVRPSRSKSSNEKARPSPGSSIPEMPGVILEVGVLNSSEEEVPQSTAEVEH